MAGSKTKQTISVIVPRSPFVPQALRDREHCLAALDVADLMRWWPGQPHQPHRNAEKVRAIQRSLDWRRVGQIAAYLLQAEVRDAREKITQYFESIYEPTSFEPGREWPPRVPRVIGFERSEYPIFSNVLIHMNGARIERDADDRTGRLTFDEEDEALNLSVIDGQHRINGAFLALCIRREEKQDSGWEIPAEIFLDLDKPNQPPRRQAQIFIDVNFNQKKVDRSLVADLFPTARGPRAALDKKERAQDLGRRLMLETGPLVGMIQIPGIRYGVKDVVTLATLNSAIEDVLDDLDSAELRGLDEQTEFLAQCLEAWFVATGRQEEVSSPTLADPENVAYQGRVVVSFLTLIPACVWKLRQAKQKLTSQAAGETLSEWLRGVLSRAGLLEGGKLLPRSKFRQAGYLGSGGIARFRDELWAATLSKNRIARYSERRIASLAQENRATVRTSLAQ